MMIRFLLCIALLLLGALAWFERDLVHANGATATLEQQQQKQHPHAKNRPSSFQEARSRYETDRRRPSLFIRTRTTERMAAFRETEGFELLMRRYQRPHEEDEPHDHVRYTTVNILSHYYGRHEEVLEQWAELRDGFNSTEHSWLWFHAQQALARNGKPEQVLESLEQRRMDPFLRAATIEALAYSGREEVLEVITASLSDRRQPRGLERSLQVEAAASAIYRLRHELGSERFDDATRLVIKTLDDRRLPERTKLVVARHLKELFNEQQAWDDSETWLRILERGSGAQDPSGGGQSGVQFFNVPAIGERIAFIIDFSCSMLIPLTDGERDEMRGPVTGGGGGAEEEDELPWDQISNRFELAREELKRSLRNLPEGVHFCVIVYGTEAKFLDSTPRLVPANRRTIQAVSAELDSFTVGPPEPDTGREYGRLLGNTNMHGALMRAFQITDRGRIDQYEHVDPQGFERGIDTILHLSDGTPSYDDFAQRDRREPEDRVGDPETGHAGNQDADYLIYRGPYGRHGRAINHLVEDVRRMNLHRKVEIHNIGIGEADSSLLDRLSEIGMGSSTFIGGGSSNRRR